MRVATYNVHMLTGIPEALASPHIGTHGDDEFGERCAAHFTDCFANLDADIIGLQEGVPHVFMQPIADNLGMHLATFPSPLGRYRGLSGTLYPWGAPGHVLSAYPIIESRVWGHREPGTAAGHGGSGGPWDGLRARLRTDLGREPTEVEVTRLSLDEASALFTRTAGAALINAEGTLLWVVNVHLHPSRADIRQREGAELRRRISEELQPITPHVILMGDFNAVAQGDTEGEAEPVHAEVGSGEGGLGLINSMAAVNPQGLQGTSGSYGRNQGRGIDHIYCSASLAPLSAEVVMGPGFRDTEMAGWVGSDHMPVRGTFGGEFGGGSKL